MPRPRPWHRDSIFGDGPRVPLCRERRAVWRARLNLFRRAGRLTPLHEDIGLALARRLGTDGRLDPSQQTIADDVGCSVRSVRRALVAFRGCGLVRWVQRLVRAGLQTTQTSNSYALTIGEPPVNPALSPGGQAGRGTLSRRIFSMQQAASEVSPAARQEAQAALARVAEQRAAAVRAGLLGRNRSTVRIG